MANVIMQHPHSGIIRKAPVGFSWTTLFFYPLPALVRGDIKWFIIQFLLWMFVLPILIFAFRYNNIYLKALLERGYKVKSVNGTTIEEVNRRIGLELPML